MSCYLTWLECGVLFFVALIEKKRRLFRTYDDAHFHMHDTKPNICVHELAVCSMAMTLAVPNCSSSVIEH